MTATTPVSITPIRRQPPEIAWGDGHATATTRRPCAGSVHALSSEAGLPGWLDSSRL